MENEIERELRDGPDGVGCIYISEGDFTRGKEALRDWLASGKDELTVLDEQLSDGVSGVLREIFGSNVRIEIAHKSRE
jgi:hypothetical protein